MPLPVAPTRTAAWTVSLAAGVVLALGTAGAAPAGKTASGKDKAEPAVMRLAQPHCPPGLAKKNPPCVPPGQARQAAVGAVIDLGSVHLVSRPGLYGLGEPPKGQRYAVVNGRLMRVDRETGRILSIIRIVDAILD